MLLGLAMPVVLLFLFTSIQKRLPLEIYTAQMLTPAIVIFSFAFLMMFAAILLAKDSDTAFLTRLFTTPLKASDFILAYILPFIPVALFQVLICFLAGAIMGATYTNILPALLIFLMVSLTCTSLGIILGTFLTVNQVPGVGSLLITAIGLFSGAWMDLRMIGGVLESIGYALPFAHAVDALQIILAGDTTSIIVNLYWIIGYTVVLFILAVFSFHWRIRKG
jgi:ABC-2 type transport system permease protein